MKDKSVYIFAALECIDLIEDYTAGFTIDSFLADRKTQDAVVRNLEVIGQALKDFGIELLIEEMPDKPWAQIAGMRNVLAHEYLGVDMVMIWDTVQLHLHDLKQALSSLQNGGAV
jgi:uncharacterized protein with HEPN domain